MRRSGGWSGGMMRRMEDEVGGGGGGGVLRVVSERKSGRVRHKCGGLGWHCFRCPRAASPRGRKNARGWNGYGHGQFPAGGRRPSTGTRSSYQLQGLRVCPQLGQGERPIGYGRRQRNGRWRTRRANEVKVRNSQCLCLGWSLRVSQMPAVESGQQRGVARLLAGLCLCLSLSLGLVQCWVLGAR